MDTIKDPCKARSDAMFEAIKTNFASEPPIYLARKEGDCDKAFEGPWNGTAYVKERCIIMFPGVELHLNPDGTYFLNDSSGG